MPYAQETDSKQGVKKYSEVDTSGLPVARLNLLDPTALGFYQIAITMASKACGSEAVRLIL